MHPSKLPAQPLDHDVFRARTIPLYYETPTCIDFDLPLTDLNPSTFSRSPIKMLHLILHQIQPFTQFLTPSLGRRLRVFFSFPLSNSGAVGVESRSRGSIGGGGGGSGGSIVLVGVLNGVSCFVEEAVLCSMRWDRKGKEIKMRSEEEEKVI